MRDPTTPTTSGANTYEQTQDKGGAGIGRDDANQEQRPFSTGSVADLGGILGAVPDPAILAMEEQYTSYFTLRPASHSGQPEAPTVLPGLAIQPGDNHSAAVQEIIDQIRALWVHGREYRIVIGRLLIRLHDLLCKPGYGSFMATVTNPPPAGLGIPYTTARDHMADAREADGHPYEIRNDEPSTTDDKAEIPIVDNAAQIADAVQQEQAKVAEAQEAERYSDVLRIDCRLAPALHGKCKERIKLLGAQEVGTRIYQALFPEEFNADQRNHTVGN
jgi:hypothetical protein